MVPQTAGWEVDLGLHFLDPLFREVSLNSQVRDLVREIGFQDPRMLQSMIICKQPEIGGKGTSSLGFQRYVD